MASAEEWDCNGLKTKIEQLTKNLNEAKADMKAEVDKVKEQLVNDIMPFRATNFLRKLLKQECCTGRWSTIIAKRHSIRATNFLNEN